MSARYIIYVIAFVLLTAIPLTFAQGQSAATPAPADDGVIGTILEIEGTATVTPQGGTAAPAAVNQGLHLNDVIETGAKSRVFVLLIDNTQWTLSENTKLSVNEWVYDADDSTNNRGRYSILQGAFQYVSGLIAKKQDPDVQIETPAGSIGIRGTDITGGDVDGEYGIQVDDGAIDVKTDAGSVRVNKGEGTTIKGRAFAPARPGKWNNTRLARIRQQVYLQHRDRVQQRMAKMQERHADMRQRYKQYMQAHPQQRQEMRQQMRDNRQQQMRENRQERWQQQRGQQQNGQRPLLQQQRLQGQPEKGLRQQQAQDWRQTLRQQNGGRVLQQQNRQQGQQQAAPNLQAVIQQKQEKAAERKEKQQEIRNNRRKRWQEKLQDQQQGQSQETPAQ